MIFLKLAWDQVKTLRKKELERKLWRFNSILTRLFRKHARKQAYIQENNLQSLRNQKTKMGCSWVITRPSLRPYNSTPNIPHPTLVKSVFSSSDNYQEGRNGWSWWCSPCRLWRSSRSFVRTKTSYSFSFAQRWTCKSRGKFFVGRKQRRDFKSSGELGPWTYNRCVCCAVWHAKR